MPGNWKNSNRGERLPSNWAELRRLTKERAGDQCQALLRDGRRCPDQGTDCDHIVAGDNHDLSNLQWLCRWHHNKKSSYEGNKSPNRKRVSERRPKPPHPGFK